MRENEYRENKTVSEKRKRMNKNKRRQQIVRRRKQMLMIGAAAAVIIIIIALVVNLSGKGKNDQNDGSKEITLVESDITQLRILSFDTLSINESDGKVSAEQFGNILQDMYDSGYCLVDIYDAAYTDSEGNFSYKETISVPEGKKPLIIIQRNVSYAQDNSSQGLPSKLIVDGGKLVSEYTQENGTSERGNYDIVPIIEDFISKHPDFSYDGARGVLGVSGENGIFGSGFDEAKEVIDAVSNAGWHFASIGYGNDISYGSEFSIMSEDVDKWEKEVESFIGETNIIILPKDTDIGSWAEYKDTNQKYALLKEKGFSYFLLAQNTTPYMIQVRPDYVRITFYKINTFEDYNAAMHPVEQEGEAQAEQPAGGEQQSVQPEGETQTAQPTGETQAEQNVQQ
jgi:hypothetical protein